jgi:hypothetical protein
MKLGKEEIQKIFLGTLLLIGLIYGYFSMLLGPLKAKQAGTEKAMAALRPEIQKARAKLRQVQAIEESAPAAKATVDQIHAMIPEGSPVAWFPPRITEFFKLEGGEKTTTRLTNEFPEKELPGFRRLAWGIDLPKIEFLTFAAAVAHLENEEPLLEIVGLQVQTSKEDIETQHILLTVNNLVKQ